MKTENIHVDQLELTPSNVLQDYHPAIQNEIMLLLIEAVIEIVKKKRKETDGNIFVVLKPILHIDAAYYNENSHFATLYLSDGLKFYFGSGEFSPRWEEKFNFSLVDDKLVIEVPIDPENVDKGYRDVTASY